MSSASASARCLVLATDRGSVVAGDCEQREDRFDAICAGIEPGPEQLQAFVPTRVGCGRQQHRAQFLASGSTHQDIAAGQRTFV